MSYSLPAYQDSQLIFCVCGSLGEATQSREGLGKGVGGGGGGGEGGYEGESVKIKACCSHVALVLHQTLSSHPA